MARKKLYDTYEAEIPDGFEPMTDDEKKMYYGPVNIDHAFLNKDDKALITFTRNDFPLSAENLEERLKSYLNLYARIAPGFKRGEVLKAKDDSYAMFSFKSNGVTRDIGNVVGIIPNDGKELIFNGSFNFNDYGKYLQKYANIIMKSSGK